MRFYETTFEEYLKSVDLFNLHEEITYKSTKDTFENLIVYGPSGVGKYSQVLSIIKQFSPSNLKYEKKIVFQIDKQEYIYHISDIHYEVDMSLLGCNSKNIWHDIFSQIVDIISVKSSKMGIIVCKNFHTIHNELLEIFYSYIQQFNSEYMSIKVKFILITEHLSFISQKILNACEIIHVRRPSKESYTKLLEQYGDYENKYFEIPNYTANAYKKDMTILNHIEPSDILNTKELRSFSLVSSSKYIPADIFNTVCDIIIKDMERPHALEYTKFRDSIYDILIYNLDAAECVWYILCYFIHNGKLSRESTSAIIGKTFLFLKYYNNNYRPIYHLESIFFYIIHQLINENGP